ncbi:class I SAM-dependent methyltransferase [Methylobacterium sp. J-030]|uniref:methyltransferase domain-containing protein n=1 Tax=Methylobacterium sp. J-030 TaxID=2836627 RepID=UPI001FB9B52D|nr:methyltransferase domain-containing protein [Methylobacterium sp. J-030]MCJ2072060.1 class I SAM-dependent methyltransferase [Methylobacterium sp. J-030]
MTLEYAGVASIEVAETPHLGGNANHGDPYSFAPSVVRYVTERFALRSMLDLGSGQGHVAAQFHRQGVIAIACDGLTRNITHNVYPVVQTDFTKGPFACHVDLTWCQEVAEHVEERHLDYFVRSLTCGKIILMTHAVPGQHGYHHVNCNDTSYWLNVINQAGYDCVVADTNRIRKLAEAEGAAYLARTGLLFVRR